MRARTISRFPTAAVGAATRARVRLVAAHLHRHPRARQQSIAPNQGRSSQHAHTRPCNRKHRIVACVPKMHYTLHTCLFESDVSWERTQAPNGDAMVSGCAGIPPSVSDERVNGVGVDAQGVLPQCDPPAPQPHTLQCLIRAPTVLRVRVLHTV